MKFDFDQELAEMFRKFERCTIWKCENEAEGVCDSCGCLLCYVHAFPLGKQRYCHRCYAARVVIPEKETGF